jgi:hypothetical protein
LSLASGGASVVNGAPGGDVGAAGSITVGLFGRFGGSQKVVVDRSRQAVIAGSVVVGRLDLMLISKLSRQTQRPGLAI